MNYRKSKNSKNSNVIRCIASVLLAVLLITEPSMLVFAQSGESELNGSDEAKVIQSENEQTVQQKPEDSAKDEEAEDNAAIIENSESDPEDEKQEQPSSDTEEEVRETLQHNGEDKQPLRSTRAKKGETRGSGNDITVTVRIKNETYPVSKGAPWDGVLLDTEVTVPSDYTMMEALHKACQDNGITSIGTDSSYVSMIGGLSEFDGGGGSGWMGTLNDWFVNQGFDQMSIKNGDVIVIEYTCELGEDVGSSFTLKDKRLKDIEVSVGKLTPEFDSDFDMYNLTVPEGTSELSIYTTAVNRNYLVKSIVGNEEYERGAKIPVHDGMIIRVKCGDPSWPSMNAYEQQDTVKPVTYTIAVFEGAYEFLADVSGEKCEIELDRESGLYSTGEKVTARLVYDKSKYQINEDGVRAYVGGSKKYIQLSEESEDVYSFTMPGNDVEIRAACETKDDYPLEVTGSLKGCRVTLDHADGKYVKNSEVIFTLTPDAGRRINDLSVKAEEAESGDALELSHLSQDRYSFIMPGEDVVIYAESEEITANGLKGYTIKTNRGEISGRLMEASRTSICTLPERAAEFDLSLDIDESEELTTVRVKNIFGQITTYTDTEIKGIEVGTYNTALYGKEVTVSVITKDSDNKSHTYTIRINTVKNDYDVENPDATILCDGPVGLGRLPYKKTMMTSGVQLYEVDYPTVVTNHTAQMAAVTLRIKPSYEEVKESIEIRCKYASFMFTGVTGWSYDSSLIRIKAGETLEIPIEIDYIMQSGEKVTRRYLYRITNARYTKQRFRVLTNKGNPMTPSNFAINGNALKVSELSFEDGCFSFDLAPGEYTASSMGESVAFTVPLTLDRPIETDIVDIKTDTPEYTCKVNCTDKKATFSITETSAGIEYYVKSSETVFSLPPGRYMIKAYNDGSHRYSKKTVVITDNDVTVELDAPYLMDPLYVVEQLNLLEEIQGFDDGNGRIRIHIPNYQTGSIVVKPIVKDSDGLTMYAEKEGDMYYYYVDRDIVDHVMKLKYEVYNAPDPLVSQFTHEEPEKFYTDEMELYVPAYDQAEPPEEPKPDIPPANELRLGYDTEDGSIICGLHYTNNAEDQSMMVGSAVKVVDKTGRATIRQLYDAGYKVKYTMRYSATRDGHMTNVGYKKGTGWYAGIDLITVSDGLALAVFETSATYGSTNSFGGIDPSISNGGGPAAEIPGWFEITAWFEDKKGNKSNSETITVYKDGRSPRANVSISQKKGVYIAKQSMPAYTNEPITITVGAGDDGIGLHENAYSFDGGKTWGTENTRTFSSPAEVDIRDIYVRDALGNVTTGTGTSFDADMYSEPEGVAYWNNPDGEITWTDGQNKDEKVRYFYIDTEYPTAGVITDFDDDTDTLCLTVKGSDEISGLAAEPYSFDGGETWQSENTFTVNLGEYSGENIKVRDRAGNITTYNPDYVWTRDSFSGKGPVIKDVKVEYGEGGGIGDDGRKWYQSATVTIEAEAGDSEIVGYSFDGQRFTMSDTKEITKGQYFPVGSIQVIDRTGNIAIYDQALDVTNVDSVAPVIDIYSFKGYTAMASKEIYLSIEASDALSKGLKYAVTAIPIDEYRRGYKMPDLQLEWADSFDDDQFKVSNLGKKYDRKILVTGGQVLPGILSSNPAVWGIRMWVKDAAGNVSHYDTWTDGGYIDQEGPKITEVTTEYKRFNDESGIVKVYVAASEPKYGAGLAGKAYSFDGGKTWQASNSTTIPIGASIPAGQIMVRDQFGNMSTYNKVVKTTLQNVITKIKRLDPKTAKDKDYKEILDLYKQLSDREKSKVYNWQDFLDMLGNRKDQDWDDDYGDIGEPDDSGEQGGDDPVNPDDPDDGEEGSGDEDGDSDKGAGSDDGVPSDGNGSGSNGGTPESDNADGGTDRKTVSVTLSNSSTSSVPDVKADSGQNFREAEIDKVGGGLLSQGMVKLWELILLLIIVGGAYTYGAGKRYKRYHEEI